MIQTKNSTWQDTSKSFINAMDDNFFKRDGVMTEPVCEPDGSCDNVIVPAIQGLAAQWLGATLRVVPYNIPALSNKIRSSAQAAARQCSGGKDNQTACGMDWTIPESDGEYGLGQELSAMNVIVANLRAKSAGTSNTTSSNSSTTAASGAAGTSSSSTGTPATPSQAIGSGSVSLMQHMAGNFGMYTILAATLCLMTG